MPRARSQVSPLTIWTIGFHVLLILGTLAILRSTWMVIAWILIATFIALALDPLVHLLQRTGLPRAPSVFAVMLGVLGGFGLMVWSLIPMIVEQVTALSRSLPALLARLQKLPAFRWVESQVDLSQAGPAAGDGAGTGAGAANVTSWPVFAVAGQVAIGLLAIVTITFLVLFMLLFGRELFDKALGWFKPEDRGRYVLLTHRMHRRVGGYVSGTLMVAAVSGLVVGITLVVVGNPYFLPLGFVMVVLSIIPFVGSTLGAFLAVGTTLAAQGIRAALIVAAVYLVYQQVENQLLQPLVQRRTIKMNPLLISLVMLVGTALAGLLGALLALPVAGAIQVVLLDLRQRRQVKWQNEARARMPEDDRQLVLLPPEDDGRDLRH